MSAPRPIVNSLDRDRLIPLIADAGHPPGPAATLRATIDAARILPPQNIPDDVVTMNSTVRIRYLNHDDPEVLTLAYPAEAKGPDRISVLAPLGAALLGWRIGDQITWIGPRTPRVAVIDAIDYQPERAGHFDR